MKKTLKTAAKKKAAPVKKKAAPRKAVTPKKPIMERVKSYEDACKVLRRKPMTLKQFSIYPMKDRKAKFSEHRVETVIEALNEDHVFNWDDWNEYKYYPYFDMRKTAKGVAGSGFACYDFSFGRTHSSVGARRVVRTAEHAKYVGTMMEADYRNFMKK